MDITRHPDWREPSIEISDKNFTIEIVSNNVDIICDWDYGWGGRGSESVSIPLDIIETIIKEYRNYA
jgi:hypothetical protein